MPWDAGGVGVHGSVFKDPIDSRWKAYVVCTPAEFAPLSAAEPWQSDNGGYRRLCLFESADGVHWTRPELSNVPLGEHAKTNIIFDLKHGVSAYPSVLVDPDNRQWPYTMIVLREYQGTSSHGAPPQGNGYYRYRSKDGKAWELVGKVQGPMTKWDLAFFYRNPEGGLRVLLPGLRCPSTDRSPAALRILTPGAVVTVPRAATGTCGRRTLKC